MEGRRSGARRGSRTPSTFKVSRFVYRRTELDDAEVFGNAHKPDIRTREQAITLRTADLGNRIDALRGPHPKRDRLVVLLQIPDEGTRSRLAADKPCHV
jgi:hypothetical protein